MPGRSRGAPEGGRPPPPPFAQQPTDAVLAQEATFAPDIAKRIGEALEGRRFSPTETTRGLRDIYAASVYAVPFIITKTASGSGVVVAVDGMGAAGHVVTNHHVAASAWQD